MKTRAISSLFTAITDNEFSHSSGFVRILKAQLDTQTHSPVKVIYSKEPEDWNEFDEIYVWQGLDLNGKLSMNLFGGSCEQNARHLMRLGTYQGDIRGVLYPVLPYHELRKRDWSHTSASKEVFDWLELRHKTQKSPVENPCQSNHLCIGDSHVPSVWKPGTHIKVLSGMTLYGALARDLRTLIPRDYQSVTLCFGQIDIRHHLCRTAQPATEARQLGNAYVRQILELRRHGVQVEVALLHPIESEERKIPTPGWYKGSPFYGSVEDRNVCRIGLNYTIQSGSRLGPKFDILKFPQEWMLPNGLMDQSYMERPRSVHIAPRFYRAFR
jgi:hypothetical protein